MLELETLSAEKLREALARGMTTAVVPFGSIEHQGAHLPLGADALLADVVGREVASRLDALLTPTFRIGSAAAHAALAGTLTVDAQTVTDLASGVAVGLARDGVRAIAFVCTHGGNAEPLRQATVRLSYALRDQVVCAPRGDLGPHPGSHSGEWLTSVMLALRPDLVHLERAPKELGAELAQASRARGTEHLERFVSSIVVEIRAAIHSG